MSHNSRICCAWCLWRRRKEEKFKTIKVTGDLSDPEGRVTLSKVEDYSNHQEV